MDKFVKEGEEKPMVDVTTYKWFNKPKEPIQSAKDLLDKRISLTFQQVIDFFEGKQTVDHRDSHAVGNLMLIDFCYVGYISDGVLLEIMRAGFRYRQHIGPMGERINVIEL